MQKKFIDITMKHLMKNKSLNLVVSQFLFVFMTVSLISCTHIMHIITENQEAEESSDLVFDEELISEANPSPEKHEYIYCTPEDKKKGKNAIFGDINAPCGLSEIQPMNNRTLEIKRVFLGIERHPDGVEMPAGHHLLLLKEGDKILQEIKVETEYDPFWYEVVFVKIRKNVYWQDLNNDGHPEFAVLPRDTGNALYRPVNIYTLKNESFHFYGQGKYLWEAGEHVLLNCPKCWKYDLNECKKCT